MLAIGEIYSFDLYAGFFFNANFASLKAMLKISRRSVVTYFLNKEKATKVKLLAKWGIRPRVIFVLKKNESWYLCIICQNRLWMYQSTFYWCNVWVCILLKIYVSDSLLTAISKTGRNTGLVSRASWQTLFIQNRFCAVPTELKSAEFLFST